MTLTDPYYTCDEVAEILKFKTPRPIWLLIKSGQLPALEVARQWRIDRDDLHSYLNRQKTAPPVIAPLDPERPARRIAELD